MMRSLSPKIFTFQDSVIFALIWAAMIILSAWSLSITPEMFFHSPRMVICLILMVALCLFTFVGYPNGLGRKRCFVIDEASTKAKLAPPGLYWRFKTHWYRGHGGRLVCIPMGSKTYRVGRDALRIIIDHGYDNPTPEFAERVFRLYHDLESVKDGTADQIEAAVRHYYALGYDLPEVTLNDVVGRFVAWLRTDGTGKSE